MHRKKGGGKYTEIAKEGFAGFFGGLAALVLYMVVGMIMFIPGLVLLNRENKKPKGQRNTGIVVVAYVLMFLGAAIGLGLGFGILTENLVAEF